MTALRSVSGIAATLGILIYVWVMGPAEAVSAPASPSNPAVGGTAARAAGDCPTSNFPEVSADPANGAYPDPSVQVSCNSKYLKVRSNGIPNYEFVQTTPNELQAQDHTFKVPLYPALVGETTEIPLLDTVAFAVNGIPIFGPNEGPLPDPFGDPVFNGLLDDCLGHTAERGDYHYHAMLVTCPIEGIIGRTDASPVIGYANDGFPIYGPFGCSDADCSKVIEYQSAWQQIGDPSTFAWDAYEYAERKQDKYLDQCNGHEGPQGDYHYHATEDFPYLLGCYSGSEDPGAAPPSNLRAKTRSNQRVLLRWKDNAKSETGYRVEMAAGDGDFEAVTETGKNVKKYLVEDLEAGETYTFRVRALSKAGVSNPSSAVSATAK